MNLNRIFWVSICLLCSFLSYAQNYTIKGQLSDTEKSTPIEAATVYAEAVKDSTLITYTISDAKGNFELIANTGQKKIKVLISSVGYESYQKEIPLTEKQIDLGTIKLGFNVESLDEVVVKSRAPVTIKKDTLEFNVASFKTKKDANVEDLLKELPGVEVDEDGKIKINGKEVNKVLVNGKPFFGDDPTIATRNLTKDIVDKIQVTDSKTDAEAFAGEQGDKNNKTINITIQEDKNKGTFGRIAAGLGTEERYEGAGLINFFDNDQRISVLAGTNNINSPGFSFGEIRKMFGGGGSISFNSNGAFTIDGRSFGGGEGIVTSRNVGANYADDFGKNISITANYFYAGSDSDNERLSERENILTDGSFFTNASSTSENKLDNHDANIIFNVKIDSTFLMNVKPSFKAFKSENRFISNDQSLDENQTLTNSSNLNSFSETEGRNFKNDIDVTKKYGNRGAFVKASITNQINNGTSNKFLQSTTEIFGDTPETISRDQVTDGENSFNSLSTSFTWRYPLISKKLFADVKYGYRRDVRENVENTFDFNELTQQYEDFNDLLSTDFKFKNIRKTPGLSLSYSGEKLNIRFGGGYVFRTLENSDRLRNIDFEKDFNALELNASLDANFSPKESVYLGYSKSNRPPEISQLQPFQDVSDPLNIVTGNPNLAPSNSHNLYMGYNNYDFQKGSGFYSYFNVNVIEDKVVPRTIIDENLIRNTTYDNVDGDYNIYGSLSKSKSFKLDSLRKIKVTASMYGSLDRRINFNNDVKYASNRLSMSPAVFVSFKWKGVFDINPNYRISFTNNTYDIDLFNDRDFISHSVGIRTTTYVPKQLEWRNDIRYNYNPDVAPGFQRNSWFWNTTVAYSLFKKKATVTLKVYDLLNQNTNAKRNATDNYIEDIQSTVLEQYFMLSFSYKFNSLGKKGETGGEMMFFN
ncbi:outer membrane beta-barrel protein [Aquimarina sp. 2201CG5-10]|uniref:outer membrane beta-barrel protein n=1 Tax=Aquimarina callyspongiae TaxID=3098150 RepID=UPI002AB34BAA|nr:outer membrane beta-barrel protein [Aquimarina sp. 2201CG5-10]MDY8134607.1 outer membrane beta-barrel protein [Aquimarina sp. 2201CG5-10]